MHSRGTIHDTRSHPVRRERECRLQHSRDGKRFALSALSCQVKRKLTPMITCIREPPEGPMPVAPGLRPGYAGSNVWHRIEGEDIAIAQFLSAGHVGVYPSGRWSESREAAKSRSEPAAATFREALSDREMRDGELGPYHLALKVNFRDRRNWDKIADWLDSKRRAHAQTLLG